MIPIPSFNKTSPRFNNSYTEQRLTKYQFYSQESQDYAMNIGSSEGSILGTYPVRSPKVSSHTQRSPKVSSHTQYATPIFIEASL